MTLKYLYSKFFKKILRGNCIINSKIHKTSHIDSASEFHNSTLGKYSYVGYDSQVFNTDIGAFCSIADFFLSGAAQHPIDWVSTSPAFQSTKNSGCDNKLAEYQVDTPQSSDSIRKRTIIGNDVWIGLRVIIKSGVKVGNGAVIGSGAVVTKDIPDYAIVAGVPAKIIRFRFDEKTIHDLNSLQWWNLNDVELRKLGKYIKDPLMFIDQFHKMENE